MTEQNEFVCWGQDEIGDEIGPDLIQCHRCGARLTPIIEPELDVPQVPEHDIAEPVGIEMLTPEVIRFAWLKLGKGSGDLAEAQALARAIRDEMRTDRTYHRRRLSL